MQHLQTGCLQLKRLISFCLFHVSQFEKWEDIPELGVMAEQAEGDQRLGLPESSRDALGVGTERHQQQVPTYLPTYLPHPNPNPPHQNQMQPLPPLILWVIVIVLCD